MSAQSNARFDAYLDASFARWHREDEEARRLLTIRRATIEALLPALAELLVQRFGAKRVWVAGSVARGDCTLSSDLDLAVEGMRPGLELEAGAALERLLMQEGHLDLEVDLIPVERARPTFLADLAVEGRVLRGDG